MKEDLIYVSHGLSAFAAFGAATLAGYLFAAGFGYILLCTRRDAILQWLAKRGYLRAAKIVGTVLFDLSRYAITRCLAGNISGIASRKERTV